MRKIKINSCLFVQPVKEHKKLKKKVLDYIKNNPVQSIPSKKLPSKDYITNSDWLDSRPKNGEKRTYVKDVIKVLTPYLHEVCLELDSSYSVVDISRMWFQQYKKNNFHGWHNHAHSNWSHIYYVEMKDDEAKTQFKSCYDKRVIGNVNVKEGDLLTFPASTLHCSPIIKSNVRKTVISFNSDFHSDYL
jgi:hypothetical protein|tara:strand:- start:16127 stop:16693 length:567 start_codon:yes stop_codon:yes gene_type:complete